MKIFSRLVVGMASFPILFLTMNQPALSIDDPGFTIERMVVSQEIIDREPMGVAAQFSVETQKVYCFLEAKDIEQDTEVIFIWYHNDMEMAAVSLPLR